MLRSQWGRWDQRRGWSHSRHRLILCGFAGSIVHFSPRHIRKEKTVKNVRISDEEALATPFYCQESKEMDGPTVVHCPENYDTPNNPDAPIFIVAHNELTGNNTPQVSKSKGDRRLYCNYT